jgi:putative heme-binding domain-containing protein
MSSGRLCVALAALICLSSPGTPQSLEDQLRGRDPAELAEAANEQGDAQRGAVAFHRAALSCTRCHVADRKDHPLGPDLSQLGPDVDDTHLVESILWPSKQIRAGYESVLLETSTGTLRGLLLPSEDGSVVLRDSDNNYRERRLPRAVVQSIERSSTSVMPSGLADGLISEQQFLDLVKYLIEIREGGPARARQLVPPPSLSAHRPLPDYERDLDHAGILRDLDESSLRRGEQIYQNLCRNCHGTPSQPGSLPTAMDFAHGKFRNGSDPFTLYQTLTRGFGMMIAQTWMVPQQKYDVIHYLRETYLKRRNPAQYFEIDAAYLERLPRGTQRGPEPARVTAWQQMDYGPNQAMTLEVGDDASNFAYKGNAIRLDGGPGGVSQGNYWMLYDRDTLRVAAVWSGEGFCDWHGINFDGQHAIHPRLVGQLQLANPTGPGWADPETQSFQDPRLRGRDDRPYGPLPRSHAHHKGMYSHGPHTLVSYTVGTTSVLELPEVDPSGPQPLFVRRFEIGSRDQDLFLQVAHRPGYRLQPSGDSNALLFRAQEKPAAAAAQTGVDGSRLDGSTYLEVAAAAALGLQDSDFTLTARIRTEADGTLFAVTDPGSIWVANGMTWFVRNGRLAFDIGWVGVHHGERAIDDGQWHHVALTYRRDSGELQFFVDGEADGRPGQLRSKANLEELVARVGYTAEDFPEPSFLEGWIGQLAVYSRSLSIEELRALVAGESTNLEPVAHWNLKERVADGVPDRTGHGHDAVRRVDQAQASDFAPGFLAIGTAGVEGGATFLQAGADLRLRIPAGREQLRFALWFATLEDPGQVDSLRQSPIFDEPAKDLTAFTGGGPPRWPETLVTQVERGSDRDPLAVDVLALPSDNPWFARLRLSGLDFQSDGNDALVCSWDGSVYRITGLARIDATEGASIRWRRIASGLFQPLGLKVFQGRIHVTCRDQICVLHDLNGDGETDFYESFNNDHQVTEHFHEFAMGLQADDDGNFYYAKSARHAKKALVPHHGTLLKVAKDGSRTQILAQGFRAANGVCLNPDGTFFVTDQEGHWNPKNRINHVRSSGFYGNMWGYHAVTDPADQAMEQPLCWITNELDRSPGELLWVDSDQFGPLEGGLLNLSYGHGMIYSVLHESVEGQLQGGVCALPLELFPTGIMRGRFHPRDGQLYLCGMFAWAGNQSEPGGLYRLRYTGRPLHVPRSLSAQGSELSLEFTGSLSPATATDPDNYSIRTWDLRRSSNYGSPHLNERSLQITAASLDPSGRQIQLTVPELAPTRGMEISYRLQSATGKPVEGKIHNTIHRLLAAH